MANLYPLFQASLHPDNTIRLDAERALASLEGNEGFVEAVLTIIRTPQYDQTARLSAIVYFKNRIKRGWKTPEDSASGGFVPVQPHDRMVVRGTLLQTMVEVQFEQKVFAEALRHIIAHDVPTEWPTFMDEVLAMFHSGDESKIFVAAIALNLLVKRLGYVSRLEASDELRPITQAFFPLLLDIAGKLFENGSERSIGILRVILKIYLSSIRSVMLPEMQQTDSLVPWGMLFLKVVKCDEPVMARTQDRALHPVWKAKKWACRCFFYLIRNYCGKRTRDKYGAFADMFLERFAPEILHAYLEQINKFMNGVWLSPQVRQLLAAFIEESLPHGAPWKTLKPHINGVIRGFIFPQLCFTEEDAELWVSDPPEYIRKNLAHSFVAESIWDDYADPIKAAQELLSALVEKREKVCFAETVAMTNEVMARYNATPVEARRCEEKFGALSVMVTLSYYLCQKVIHFKAVKGPDIKQKSPLYQQMENFFIADVFPEFSNPKGYMRAAACEMVKKFHKIPFSLESQSLMFERVLNCLVDGEFPVQVYAAEAVGAIISFDAIAENIKPQVPKIMEILLNLTAVIDTDNITTVMEILTEQFPDELAPFAVGLCQQLSASLRNILSELPSDMIEAMQPLEAAAGILSTISGLVDAVDADKNIVLQLEQEMLPIMSDILQSDFSDLKSGCFHLMDLFTFYMKAISPNMWPFFDAIVQNVGDDEDFLDETLAPLPNFLQFGRDVFIQNPVYVDKLVSMAADIFTRTYDVSNQKFGCLIIEWALMYLRGAIDNYIERFISMGLEQLRSEDTQQDRNIKAHLIEMIISCIYYNPMLTLQILERLNAHVFVFQLWFSQLKLFPRVFDKKLMILTLCALLEGPIDHFGILREHANHLVGGILGTFEDYPAAVEKREALKKIYEDESDDEEEEEDETEEVEITDGADSDGDLASDEDDEYDEYLAGSEKYGHLLGDDALSDFEEDLVSTTPLDDIDPYVEFASLLGRLPPSSLSYQLMHQGLDVNQQAAVAKIIEVANSNVAKKSQKE
ncbi:hypothetical protein HDU67_008267 [Dinochytrium kinnereticum]|nr:hypothetical protein HDU67_008267 [Dinochytrium kinnereticum]